MFKHMSVHTVSTTTCWDTSINREFLMKFSSEDISINFDFRNIQASVHQTPKTWFKSGILVDLSCDQAVDVLQQASKSRLFNLQNDWVLFNRHGNPNKTEALEIALHSFRKHMNRAYVMPDSRVYLLIEVDRNVWEIWNGFRLSVTEEVQVSRVGVMTPDRVEIKRSVRTNFRRVILSASTVLSIITFVCARRLNLTFSADYGWNYGNGTYSGLIGHLQREEIDFTAAGGLMRSDRMDVGELTVGTFVARLYVHRTVAIYKQPPLSSVNNVFTLPFVLNVWIVMLVVMSIFIVTLIFIIWTSNWLRGVETRLSIALDTVTLVLAAICQQGLSVTAAQYSGPTRLATFTLFLCAAFLFTSYAACIVVMLQSPSQTINTIGDLADNPITFSAQDTKHNYIYFNVGYLPKKIMVGLEEQFRPGKCMIQAKSQSLRYRRNKETVDENIKKIYLEKMKPHGAMAFTSPEIGVERVRNEFHSYLVEITLAYHIIAKTWQEHEKCSLSETELYKIPLLTLYVVKKSGYKDLFKQKMIQQHEIGLKDRITKKIMPQKQKCDSAHSGVVRFDSVSMKEIYPALLFLGYGIFTSWLLLLFEHIYKTHVDKQNT
ncbi:uncharacterized protein LOC111034171 [Myzus persicae]|uniref:uncharacterized protein LOC111034171 n=1 Tax=Myzus persicae TaxID=13164 RepID=UPI000B931361|nr:uncharacterized protein LOC111034171 [Myzus persicae]